MRALFWLTVLFTVSLFVDSFDLEGVDGDLLSYNYSLDYELLLALVPRSAEVQLASARDHKQQPKRLYAGKYESVEELAYELFGEDIKDLELFDDTKPFTSYETDFEEASEISVSILGEQVIAEVWLDLYQIYRSYKKVFEILEKLSEEDYISLYDFIYETGKHVLNAQTADAVEGEVEAAEEKDDHDDDDDDDDGEIDFGCLYLLLDDREVSLSNDTARSDTNDGSDPLVQAQLFSLILFLLKIPLIILKIILVIIWNLIEIKKLIELLEVEAVLTVLKLLKKICKIIRAIKGQIVFEIRLIVYTFKSKKPIYKAIEVLRLILRKLRKLSWILKDTIYRYRWKLYFLLKRAQKKSVIVAYYIQRAVFEKLGLPTKDEMLNLRPFLDTVNDEASTKYPADGEYFEKFKHYTYTNPGNFKDYTKKVFKDEWEDLKHNPGFDENEIFDEVRQSFETHEGDEIEFDYEEEYGFSSVKLNLKELKDDYSNKFMIDEINKEQMSKKTGIDPRKSKSEYYLY